MKKLFVCICTNLTPLSSNWVLNAWPLLCHTIQSQNTSRRKFQLSNYKGTMWRRFVIFLASKRPSSIAILNTFIITVSPITLSHIDLGAAGCSHMKISSLYSRLKNRCNVWLFCIACDVELNSMGITLSAGRADWSIWSWLSIGLLIMWFGLVFAKICPL